jgi:hypothetical protein
VSNGKITGIIDWEWAGFYPWWAERYLAHKVLDDRFDEIFDVIVDDLCPGYDTETFVQKASGPVSDASEVFEDCPRLHITTANRWFRQPFCRCKPYRGVIRERDMGIPDKHMIATAYPTSNRKITRADTEDEQ